jgi:hypothetical protein
MTSPRVTPEALTVALRGSGAITPSTSVAHVRATPLGAGHLADTFRLLPRYAGGSGPSSLVAKLPSEDPRSAATARSLGAYEREITFYQDAAPGLSVRCPTYLGTLEIGGERAGLLLEDLSTDTVPGDMLAGATVEQVRAARRELVGLQAPAWENEGLAGQAWLHRRLGVSVPWLAERYQASWAAAGERLLPDLPGAHRQAIERFGGCLSDWSASLAGPRSLVHHDYRLDNLLFSPDGAVWVLDWQIVGWGSPMMDVAYLLGGCLEPEQRRAHERTEVESHAEALASQGVAGFDGALAWEEYRRLSFAVLLVIVPALASVRSTDRGDRMLATMVRRGVQQVMDLDALEVLPC